MACTSDPSAAASFERHSVEGPGAASAGPGPPEGREGTAVVAGTLGTFEMGTREESLENGSK